MTNFDMSPNDCSIVLAKIWFVMQLKVAVHIFHIGGDNLFMGKILFFKMCQSCIGNQMVSEQDWTGTLNAH